MDTNELVLVKKSQNRWAYGLLGGGGLLFAAAFVIGISDNLPGIISLMAGGLGIVLGMSLRLARPRSSKVTLQLLYWTPRALCIVFAGFVSIFALDVFDGNKGFWATMGALAVHLIPTYLILIALAVTWRWEWVGAVLFIGLAVLYVVMAWGRFHWQVYAIMSGPLVVVGVLFLLNWIWRGELKPKGGGQF